MSEKNYMADPVSDFMDNLGIGSSLQPDAISSQVAQVVKEVGDDLVDILQTLNSRVASRHWIGKLGDTTRGEVEDLATAAKTAAARVDEHVQDVQAVSESAATARSVCQQNSGCTPGMSPMAQMKAIARALQNHYHEPSEPEYPTLDYPGRPAGAQSQDRGESPDGPSQTQHASSTGGGGSPAAGGGVPAGGAALARNAAEQSADAGKPETGAGGSPAGEGQGSGAGSGGGSPSAGGGEGSGAGGGSPAGGSPASGSPSSGAGFDPSAGETSAMSADTLPGSVSSGVGGGLGGVGGLGSDHERALSGKPGMGAAAGKPVVNVNGLLGGGQGGAGMGGFGGGMGGAQAGKKEEKERKTPDYLVNEDNGYELIEKLPVVSQEVIGELDHEEQLERDELLAEQEIAVLQSAPGGSHGA